MTFIFKIKMSSAVLWPAAQSQNTANKPVCHRGPIIYTLQASLTLPLPCYLKQPHYSTDRNTITQTRAHSGDDTIRHMHSKDILI